MFTQKKSLQLLELAFEKPFDIIIVPGMPYRRGRINTTTRIRIYWSKYLYDNGATNNIMYSGGAVYTPFYESKIMAMVACNLGIPESVIYTETRAEHSTENVYYSYKKSKLLGFSRIALATDRFQTMRVKRFIEEKVDREVGFVPLVYSLLKGLEFATVSIDDSKAFNPNFVSLTKRKSLVQRLRGIRGDHINHSFYSESESSDG